MTSYKVNIVGATGYVGGELVRLVLNHPNLELNRVYGNSKAGLKLSEIFSSLEFSLPETVVEEIDLNSVVDCDVLFLALPHTQSQNLVSQIDENDIVIVDLSADFRFEDTDTYEKWYNAEHVGKNLQEKFQYGLVEIYRNELVGHKRIAVPGCYPTSAILALNPLIKEGLSSDKTAIVDAASGVSGAGINPTQTNIFSNIDSNYSAYGLINHRHTPEMSKELGVEVLFTPHLLPISRGIVATCYLKTDQDISSNDLFDIYQKYYGDEVFVKASTQSPNVKQVVGTNNAIVSAFYDERTKNIIAISAIDNLLKGAAGQAVQAMNVSLELEESLGLSQIAIYP